MTAPVDDFLACAFCDTTVERAKGVPEGWARDHEGRVICVSCQEDIEAGEKTARRRERQRERRRS